MHPLSCSQATRRSRRGPAGKLDGARPGGDQGWRLEMEWTRDLGKTWEKTGPLNDGKTFSAIQPSILRLADGALGLVCRSKQGKVLFARSEDQGRTWSALAALDLPNPNSGIDAVTLADGRQVMVYNDTPRGRTPLNVAVSAGGVKWTNVLTLESSAGGYSYPAGLQTQGGEVPSAGPWLAAVLMGAGAALMRGNPARRSVLLVPVAVLCLWSSYGGFFLRLPPLEERWSGRVCRQSSQATCGPAAAATLLAAHGVRSSE